MNARVVLPMVLGAGAALGGAMVTMTVGSAVGLGVAGAALTAHGRATRPPCAVCEGRGSTVCTACRGDGEFPDADAATGGATNVFGAPRGPEGPLRCPTCDAKGVQKCLNCAGKRFVSAGNPPPRIPRAQAS